MVSDHTFMLTGRLSFLYCVFPSKIDGRKNCRGLDCSACGLKEEFGGDRL